MIGSRKAFSSYSVDDIEAARRFYQDTLGLEVTDTPMGFLDVHLNGGATVMLYAKPDHQVASFTVLNFEVDDIDVTVDDLVANGVVFERYDGAHQDDKGIARGKAANMGPDIAWFADPAGNILAVMGV